jgi:hypothetical protein
MSVQSRIWKSASQPVSIRDPSLLTAFGELKTADFFPLTGWSFRHNINPGLVVFPYNTGATGSVVHDTNAAVISTGADPAGFAELQTIKPIRYTPRFAGEATFTAVYDTPQPNSRQYIGALNARDGWGFGYDTNTKFGIFRRSAGVDNWTYQDTWNRDLREILNPQVGNVYQISWQWLGYGMQFFKIETINGNFGEVHVIAYANTSAETSVDNPDVPITMRVENLGNTTPISMSSPSAMGGIYGDAFNSAIAVVLAQDNTKAIAANTPTPIISFYNDPVYFGKASSLFVQALRVIVASDGNKSVSVRAYANGIPDAGATYPYINEAVSPVRVSRDITSLNLTGAVQIGTFPLAKVDTLPVDLTGSQFLGFPGQYITLVAESTGASEVTAGVSFRQFL